MPVQLTPAQCIERAGRVLWGELWQSALARELHINVRTIQRIYRANMEGSDYPVDPNVIRELEDLICERITDLKGALDEITPTREAHEQTWRRPSRG